MDKYPITEKNKVRRSPKRGAYDQKTVYEILDAGFVCQVGFIKGDVPIVIPMTYGRKDNALFLHGASTSRIMELLHNNGAVCINVTFVDGIVFAQSTFDTSVNYRSVVIFGNAEILKDEEKEEALYCISEYIVPGRWEEVRAPSAKELKATSILKVTIESASAKIRTGPPKDNVRDLELPVWAGVVPLYTKAGTPIDDPLLTTKKSVSGSAQALLRKHDGNEAL